MTNWFNILTDVDKNKARLRALAITNNYLSVVALLDNLPKTLWYNLNTTIDGLVKALKKYQELDGDVDTAYGVGRLKSKNYYSFKLNQVVSDIDLILTILE
jgi:hypothetical protein